MAPHSSTLPGKSHGWRSLEGCSPWSLWGLDTTERLHFTFHFHALEKEMATHSSVLAWRIPGTGEPGGLPSLGSHRVGHDWSDSAAAAATALLLPVSMYLTMLDDSYEWNNVIYVLLPLLISPYSSLNNLKVFKKITFFFFFRNEPTFKGWICIPKAMKWWQMSRVSTSALTFRHSDNWEISPMKFLIFLPHFLNSGLLFKFANCC